jgi:hypothetical protein
MGLRGPGAHSLSAMRAMRAMLRSPPKPQPTPRCQHCHRPFTRRSHARYCSNACKQADYRRRRARMAPA